MEMKKVLLLLTLLVLTLSACQQETNDLYTLAIFKFTDAPTLNDVSRGLQTVLEDNGLLDNIRLDYRNANGSIPEAQKIAKQLVSEGVDMIVVLSSPCLQAVILATRTVPIPIVFSSVANPFLFGVGSSENDHLNNVTGISSLCPIRDGLEFIKEVIPDVKTIGTLWTPSEDNSEYYLKLAREAAEGLGLEIKAVSITRSNEILQSTHVLINEDIDAIYQISDNATNAAFEVVGRVADENGIPLFAGFPTHTLRGACAAIGWDFYDMGLKTGQIVLRVKGGTSPKDIPIQYMTDKKLHINLEAAQKQGVVFSDEIIQRADEIVDQNKNNGPTSDPE